MAAVYDLARPERHVFTEADWNESATPDVLPYPVSKTRAERTAHAFVKALPEQERFEMTAVNPTFVLGPVDAAIHLRTSPSLIQGLASGRIPFIPDFYFNLVDVRDVAEAHVQAMLIPSESLQSRYICFAEQWHLKAICERLRAEYPKLRFPKRTAPTAFMYAYALFDRRLTWSYLKRTLGRRVELDNTRARHGLGIRFRPIHETLKDTVESMVEHGFVR